MKFNHRTLLTLWAAWLAGSLSVCSAKEPAAEAQPSTKVPGEDWVRLSHGSNGQLQAMQTAIVRYEGFYQPSGRKVVVDLIGAVHIGDAKYYQLLNQRFTQYQALLYELVAPEGTVIQKGAKASARHPLGAMQAGTKDLLDLQHQLELVDYTRPNFVHADMSPEQFFESMNNRGESIVQMIMRMTGHAIAMQGTPEGPEAGSEVEILFALFSSDRARRLKVAMAKQLAKSESMLAGFGGEQGSTIINERNRVALEVLERELKAGRQQVGVFYGAGHLKDMDERLQRDFGLKPTNQEWLTAWDLRPANER